MVAQENRIFEFDGKLIISNGPNEFWNGAFNDAKLDFNKFSKTYFKLEEDICPVSIDSNPDFKETSFVSFCQGSTSLNFFDYPQNQESLNEENIQKNNFSAVLQSCPGCLTWKHIRIDSDNILLISTDKKMIFLMKKDGSIFSSNKIKIEGDIDFSAADIKLEVLRDQNKLLFYN